MRNNSGGVSDHGGDSVGDNGVGDNGTDDSRVGNDRSGHGNHGVGSNGMSSNSHSRSVLRSAGVAHVLDDPIAVVAVGDGLDPAVRKVDGVAAGGGVSVPLLGLGEVSSAVVVSHSVLVVVDWRLGEVTVSVPSSRDEGHSSGEGGGDSEESSSDESLENMNMLGLKNIVRGEHSPSWLRSVCCKSYSE